MNLIDAILKGKYLRRGNSKMWDAWVPMEMVRVMLLNRTPMWWAENGVCLQLCLSEEDVFSLDWEAQ